VFNIELLSQAEDELTQAYDCYEDQVGGLDNKFYDEISYRLNFLETNPYYYPVNMAIFILRF